ncbi:MAG: tetratricopeptide repeat protein [Vicinamibacterales bacterium]|nr:tetratricopeptide repeat protein [Vicinamibacterales bacterium]
MIPHLTMRHVCAWVVLPIMAATTTWAAPADANQKAVCRSSDARAAVRACTQLINDRGLGADDRLLAHVNRANAYDAVGERERARKDYDTALAIAPKSPWVYRNRGAMFMGAGQLDDALRDFDAAVALDPGYGYAWASRCNTRRMMAERTQDVKTRRALTEQALIDCEQAFTVGRLDEFLAGTHEVRGLVRQALGHLNGALEDFTALVSLRPDHARARLARADSLRLAAQGAATPAEQTMLLRDSLTEYANATTLGGLGAAEVLAYYNRGLVDFQLRRFDEAITDFTSALGLAEGHPLLPYIYAGRAMALADTGAINRAQRDVDMVSTLSKGGSSNEMASQVLESARDYVNQRGL